MDPSHFTQNSSGEKGSPRHNSRMSDDTFDQNLLTEKLSKLNSSQQSIESTSKWCMSHRKKAKQVVETWERLFKSAVREQRVSLLYLANDILQNSRRKGSEFVNEFWKVLPAALKAVYDSGDGNCRKVASRLVDIWEERKVFGSRGQNLKNELLGKNPLPGKIPPPPKNHSPVNIERTSNPIKVVKKDANFLRIKLAVGGLPEKILTSFQVLHDEVVNEEGALNNCRNVVSRVQEIEKDVVIASSQGNPLDSDVVANIEIQENLLQQSISQLENSEAIRVAMVSQLREALEDQESKLELIRSELLVARDQVEQAANLKLRLTSNFSAPPIMNQQPVEPTFPSALPTNNQTLMPPSHPLTSFMNSITEEDSKKATVAAVAAKLAASASSAQMLQSVLSSLVAEEAASMGRDMKRPKLDNPMSFSNSEGGSSAYFPTTAQQQSMTNLSHVQSNTSQGNQLQVPYLPPPPPPQSLAPPASSPVNQLGQSTMTGGVPYGYGPPPSNGTMGFARPPGLPQQPQPQQQQQQLQPTNGGGYYRPVGIGFYGQNHQPSTPPIHRQ
ncbi:hypothetical protein ACJIZ3_005528 [Penstemon smallii]|uniref:CID domain-containing protein n=1 Tax=Penstemon smallii TaxID=265156 RepID=A0ABD3S556_9LAMI